MGKLSNTKLQRYLIMRLLFRTEKTFNQLLEETAFNRLILVREIGRLISNAAVSKEKIIVPEEPTIKELNELEIAKDMLGVKISKERFYYKYRLTKDGEQKLAYYEYHYSCSDVVKLPWEANKTDSDYISSINEIIKKSSYYK